VHLLMMLELSFMIVTCLSYKPLIHDTDDTKMLKYQEITVSQGKLPLIAYLGFILHQGQY